MYTITNSVLNSHCFAWHPYEKLKLFKTELIIEETESIALNTKENICEWTRENRKKPDEKSVIDYAIVSRKTEAKIKDTRVGIAGTHRLKGKE